MRAVQRVELQLDRRQAVAKLGLFAREDLLINAVGDSQIQETVLLRHEQRFLPLKLGSLRARLMLLIARLRDQDRTEPLADVVVFDSHSLENRQHLPIKLGFGHPDSRMAGFRVTGTAVVVIVAVAIFRAFANTLADDRAAAVIAEHEFAAVGEFVVMANGVAAEQRLHAVPRHAIDDRLMLSGVPLTAVLDFADVGAIEQDRMNCAARESGHPRPESQSLRFEALNQQIKRERLVSIKLENTPHVACGNRLDFYDASPVLADIAVTVWGLADEPAFLNPPGVSLTNVDRLLLGVEAGHIRQRATHHAPGGRALSRLRDRDERQAVFAFEPFEFDVVEEVAGSAIDLVEEQAVEQRCVFLGVSDQLAERLPLVRF